MTRYEFRNKTNSETEIHYLTYNDLKKFENQRPELERIMGINLFTGSAPKTDNEFKNLVNFVTDKAKGKK